MTTLYLEWQNDLLLNPSGGLALATGWDEVRQDTERLLLTSPETTQSSGVVVDADYLFEPSFGLGLRTLLGAALTPTIEAAIIKAAQNALAANPAIARNPAPIVAIVPGIMGFQLYIDVVLADGTSGTVAIGPH